METYHEAPKKNWFQRNWLWLIPSGCLVLIIVFVLFIGGIVYGAFSMVKESVPYEEAIAKMNQNELVIEALGTPVETSTLFEGNFSFTNGKSNIDVIVPVSGTKSKGMLFIVGHKSDEDEDWDYKKLEVVLSAEKDTINLLID